MKKAYTLILGGMFSLVQLGAAQSIDWRDMQVQGNDFFTIQENAEKAFEGKSTIKSDPNYSRDYKQYKRWEYYWKDRVHADGSYPNASEIKEAHDILNSTRGGRGGSWAFVGPDGLPETESDGYPGMGRVNGAAYGKVSGLVSGLYVATAGGGLWKRQSDQWSPLTDNQPFLGVTDVIVDEGSSTSSYVVIATGDAPAQHSPSLGVYISNDYGNSWSSSGLSFNDNELVYIYDLALYGTIANGVLLAATTDGLYGSDDVGANWDKILDAKCYAVEVTSNQEILVACEDGGDAAVLYSDDWGDNWIGSSPATLDPSDGRMVMAQDPNDDYHLLLVASTGYAWSTTDAGENWDDISGFPSSEYDTQGGYNMAAAISSQNDATYIVGGVHGWKSDDSGGSWEIYMDGYWEQGSPNFYVHSDHHRFYQAGSDFYTCNDGGVHKVDLFASSNQVEDLSDGLHVTQYYGVAGVEYISDYIIAGAQDNDVTKLNGSSASNLNNNSDGIDGMINYQNADIAYAASQEGALYGTDDDWETSFYVGPNDAGYDCNFAWPMAMSRQNPMTLYAGCSEVLKSMNGGLSWNAMTNGQFIELVSEIGLCSSDTNVVYASDGYYFNNSDYSAGKFYVTKDDGQTWEEGAQPSSSFPVSGIAVHPNNPEWVWVSVGGYGDGNKVYESKDYGASWTNISGTLPNSPMVSLKVDASSTDLYVGSDMGVYVRSFETGQWTSFNDGLPVVAVTDFEINYTTSKLRIATLGRGVWETDLLTQVSVNELDEVEKMASVYPNPSQGNFSIDIKNQGDYDLFIFNIVGGQVYQANSLYKGIHSVDLSSLSPGIYFAKLRTGKSYQTYKIEIAR